MTATRSAIGSLFCPTLLLLATTACPALAATASSDPARWVDPMIGTGGHGHTYPGATLPFGMVQLSPDTRLTGWDGCSGYHDTDRVVYGFSHTHLSGTGISDYGDVLFMPMTGTPLLDNGAREGPDSGYASRFEKSSERAQAGYYAVRLADEGVDVELTATERTGLHRYRFPAGRPAHVIVDLAHRDRVLAAELQVIGDREIAGVRRSTGWAEDQVVHFVARFSRPFTGTWLTTGAGDARRTVPTGRAARGEDIRAALSFGDTGGELLVQVGISAVDVDGARRNLEAEWVDFDFAATRAAARARWNEALARIAIDGGSDDQRTIFYTALYHSLIAPNLFSDVDGRYRGMDREIHRLESGRHYTVFSLWDTFRATHPLYALLERERTEEFVQTFLRMYEEGGRLPVWELAGNETDTMIGYHSVSVIADAWAKGVRGFDGRRALDAMIDSATRDHFGLEAYQRQGYVGADDDAESVSKTLEYAYDDYCISGMAADVGRLDVAAEFARRSQAWRHVLDPDTLFMRARRNQRWLTPFDPRRVDFNYTEANAWQYSFFVPHDVEGFAGALGGTRRLVERLDALFEAEGETTGRDQADITGLIGQYAHGNEPSHHMAWMYHHAGRPDLSARRVRQILDELYSTRPDGLSGNEDCGQMSSWYVFSAMGLYPFCPCDVNYTIGAPLFDRVRLRLENGRTFRIEVTREGASDRAIHVVAATLNERALNRSYLTHDEILAGGTLHLKLGERPDDRWGVPRDARPPSAVPGPAALAAPYAISDGDRFRDRMDVSLATATRGAKVHYTDDPSRPRDRWHRFVKPLRLRRSTRLWFDARRGDQSSPVMKASFHRIPNDWTVRTETEPAPEYSAGGWLSLVDGLRGPSHWRMGGWQGYRPDDFVATVDLKRPVELRRVGASFLQDQRAWIWMPTEVVVEVSDDGETFRQVARIGHDVSPRADGIVREDLIADIAPTTARWARITARSFGEIPAWHLGAGDRAWIFVDELLLE